jgi:CspA family cold shock protein
MSEEARMATGTVKFFNADRGFGFISPSDGGQDVFVHVTAVERAGLGPLIEGDKLRFETTTERGKTAATNLEKL